MYIFLITISGLLLRLINLNKPEGLWNDEYVSWFIANIPFSGGFWQEVLKQCHMPLYYLYLKPFAGMSDSVLRLTSVIPSVAAIPAMYLIGKEFSRKTGYIAASITAVLSFLIYYAQEVRFYSLLFFFSAISLLFLIKIIKTSKGWLGYIVSSILILLTHVLGVIYVAVTLCYLAYKKKRVPKYIIAAAVVMLVILIPLGTNILAMIPASQWWGNFSYTNILFLFSDFLSPILTNNVNAPPVFFYSKDILANLLLTIPVIIGVWTLIRGTKAAKGLALTSLLVIFVMGLLALSGKIVFITKYSIEILPIVILLMAIGMNDKIGKILFILFISFHLFGIFTPYYPAKAARSEGHKLAGDILNKAKPDVIIYTYYSPDRFQRYVKISAKQVYINKLNRFDYIDSPERILEEVNKGERVAVVFLDSVSFIPPELIENSKSRNLPEMFITFSIIKNAIIAKLNSDYKNFEVQRNGSWTIITAEKYK